MNSRFIPNNPMLGAGMPRMNPMQMLQNLQQNPMQFLKDMGLSIPANMTSPNDIIQHLMSSGQVSQAQYNKAREMAKMFSGNR